MARSQPIVYTLSLSQSPSHYFTHPSPILTCSSFRLQLTDSVLHTFSAHSRLQKHFSDVLSSLSTAVQQLLLRHTCPVQQGHMTITISLVFKMIRLNFQQTKQIRTQTARNISVMLLCPAAKNTLQPCKYTILP